MIVLDASALLEFLLRTEVGLEIAVMIADETSGLHVPHLIDVELAQALRRQTRLGQIRPDEATALLEDLRKLEIFRHAHEPLLERIWKLRDNYSAYDAAYIALCEALGAELITCDARLARAKGTRVPIRLCGGRLQ